MRARRREVAAPEEHVAEHAVGEHEQPAVLDALRQAQHAFRQLLALAVFAEHHRMTTQARKRQELREILGLLAQLPGAGVGTFDRRSHVALGDGQRRAERALHRQLAPLSLLRVGKRHQQIDSVREQADGLRGRAAAHRVGCGLLQILRRAVGIPPLLEMQRELGRDLRCAHAKGSLRAFADPEVQLRASRSGNAPVGHVPVQRVRESVTRGERAVGPFDAAAWSEPLLAPRQRLAARLRRRGVALEPCGDGGRGEFQARDGRHFEQGPLLLRRADRAVARGAWRRLAGTSPTAARASGRAVQRPSPPTIAPRATRSLTTLTTKSGMPSVRACSACAKLV